MSSHGRTPSHHLKSAHSLPLHVPLRISYNTPSSRRPLRPKKKVIALIALIAGEDVTIQVAYLTSEVPLRGFCCVQLTLDRGNHICLVLSLSSLLRRIKIRIQAEHQYKRALGWDLPINARSA